MLSYIGFPGLPLLVDKKAKGTFFWREFLLFRQVGEEYAVQKRLTLYIDCVVPKVTVPPLCKVLHFSNQPLRIAKLWTKTMMQLNNKTKYLVLLEEYFVAILCLSRFQVLVQSSGVLGCQGSITSCLRIIYDVTLASPPDWLLTATTAEKTASTALNILLSLKR